MDSKEFDRLLDEVSEQLDRITDQLNQKESNAPGGDGYNALAVSQDSRQPFPTR